MPVDRIQRLNEMIRRELAASLYHIGQSEAAVDPAAITFVDVSTTRDLRSAVVHVSFMGTADVQAGMLAWLRRHRVDFQAHVAERLQLKYTPKLMFRQTTAVEKGDRVLALLSNLDDQPDEKV